MLVVGIMSILAAIAIPQFSRYKRKTKVSEASENLGTLFRGEAALYQTSITGSWKAGLNVANNEGSYIFRTAQCMGPMESGITNAPKIPSPEPVSWDFNDYTYQRGAQVINGCTELGFQTDAPVYFSYWALPTWKSVIGKGWMYWNYAFHDLDGDGDLGNLIELVSECNGELQRGGRVHFGDKELIFVVIASLVGIPPAPSCG